MSVAAVFIVRNEINRIAAALFEVRPYVDEIVVVDQSSDDGTAEKAAEYANVVLRDEARGFSEASRIIACDAVQSEWILSLDADELLTSTFGPTLRSLTDSAWNGFGLLRQTIQWRPGIGTLNSRDYHHFRLWRKGCAILPTTLHGNASPTDMSRSCDHAELAILHLKTWDEQEADNERYYALGQPRPA